MMRKIETIPRMTMREFFQTVEVDTDVWSDTTDRMPVCVCPPIKFTETGEEMFKRELDEIMIEHDGDVATVICGDGDDWEANERDAFALLYSLAGYCSEKNYKKWFEKE